jgi:putative superfamily III holin-X
VHQSSLPEAMTSTDLVKELTDNAQLLLKRQTELAKREAYLELKQGKATAGLLGFAGLTAYAGVLMLLVAGAAALGARLGGRLWAGALVEAAVLLAMALVPALLGWRKLPRSLLPRTRSELSKEMTWAKYRMT